jgi:hypothetical protein
VSELVSAGGCAAVAVTRAGHALLPAPELRLESGDVLLVGATLAGLDALRGRLGSASGGKPCS